jgi:hypothetical protein
VTNEKLESGSGSGIAAAWKAWRYEERYTLDLRGRVLNDGRAMIRACLGPTKNPIAVGWSVSEPQPNGSTLPASVEGALRDLCAQIAIATSEAADAAKEA